MCLLQPWICLQHRKPQCRHTHANGAQRLRQPCLKIKSKNDTVKSRVQTHPGDVPVTAKRECRCDAHATTSTQYLHKTFVFQSPFDSFEWSMLCCWRCGVTIKPSSGSMVLYLEAPYYHIQLMVMHKIRTSGSQAAQPGQRCHSRNSS